MCFLYNIFEAPFEETEWQPKDGGLASKRNFSPLQETASEREIVPCKTLSSFDVF